MPKKRTKPKPSEGLRGHKLKRAIVDEPADADAVLQPDDMLNIRQSRFVDAYVANGGNGTRAAEAAGYTGSVNVLAQTAHHLLKLPKIRGAVEARLASDPLAMTRVTRVRLLTAIAAGEINETETTLSGAVVKKPASLDTRMRAMKMLSELAGETGKAAQVSVNVAVVAIEGMSTAALLAELEVGAKGEG